MFVMNVSGRPFGSNFRPQDKLRRHGSNPKGSRVSAGLNIITNPAETLRQNWIRRPPGVENAAILIRASGRAAGRMRWGFGKTREIVFA